MQTTTAEAAPITTRTRSAAALYRGRRTLPGRIDAVIVSVCDDKLGAVRRPLTRRMDLCNHGAGFEWGYAGSGPADLALAILADHFDRFPADAELAEGAQLEGDDLSPGEAAAVRMHQVFKARVIAAIPTACGVWSMTSEHVHAFLVHATKAQGAALPFAYLGNVEPGVGIPAALCKGCKAPMARFDAKRRRCATAGCGWYEEIVSPPGEWVAVDGARMVAARGTAHGIIPADVDADLEPPAIALPLGEKLARHLLASFAPAFAERIAAGEVQSPKLLVRAPSPPGMQCGWEFSLFEPEGRAKMASVFGAGPLRDTFTAWVEQFGAEGLSKLFGDWPADMSVPG